MSPGGMVPGNPFGYRIDEVNRSGDDVVSAVVVFPLESDWFSGHFPGNPVVPGIALMGMVVDLMQQAMGPGLRPEGFKRVRFKQIIRPDTAVNVVIEPRVRETGTFVFRLMKEKEVVCTGFVRVEKNDK